MYRSLDEARATPPTVLTTYLMAAFLMARFGKAERSRLLFLLDSFARDAFGARSLELSFRCPPSYEDEPSLLMDSLRPVGVCESVIESCSWGFRSLDRLCAFVELGRIFVCDSMFWMKLGR